MLEDHVLDEMLRDLHDAGLPAGAQNEMERRVCERVAHHTTTPPGRRRGAARRLPQRRRRAVGAGVVGVLALGGGAYALLAPQPAKISSGIACFENADRSGSMAAAQFDGRTAIETCSALWREGGLVSVVAGHAATPIPPVPELQACVDPKGKLAVQVIPSPTPAICAKNGLVSQPDAGANSKPYADLARELDPIIAKRCLSETRARQIAQDAIAKAKLPATWRVVSSSQHLSAQSCITMAPDSSAQTITLLPSAPPIDNPDDTTPEP